MPRNSLEKIYNAVRWFNGLSGTNYVELKVPSEPASNVSILLPVALPSSGIQMMTLTSGGQIGSQAIPSSSGVGYTYDQSSVPSSPSNGQTWIERDGSSNIVMIWIYNSTKAAWQSITPRFCSTICSSASTSSAVSAFFAGDISIPTSSYNVRLQTLTGQLAQTAANNTSNYFTVQLKTWLTGSQGNIGGTSPNWDTKSAGTANLLYNYSNSIDTVYTVSTWKNIYALVTGVGSSGFCNGTISMQWVYERV